jgi:FKBP-type peptidyl-prolyl cis-trans isomerase SlyD
MQTDEKLDITIEPKDAYGPYDDKAIDSVPKEQFADIELTEGMTLYGTCEHGQTTQVIVKQIKTDEIVVDFNHPMAGKTLKFAVHVLSVREATPDEISSATIGGSTGGCGCGHNDGGCGDKEHKHEKDGCCH